MPTSKMKLRLMTYNIGGGRKSSFHDDPANLNQAIQMIREIAPDILAIQEATIRVDAEGAIHSAAQRIAKGAGFDENYAFGATLSRSEHMNVMKQLFVESIFHDERDWVQGNALFSRWRLVRLGNPDLGGEAVNVPIYRPAVYEGNRDTDPRYALLARLDIPPLYPYVICTHFTTLVNERSARDPQMFTLSERQFMQARHEEAVLIRYRQAQMIVELLREHVLEAGQTAILMGDFNALADEMCIAEELVEKGGFVHLDLENPAVSTHPKTNGAVDHILIFPPHRLVEYSCRVLDIPALEDVSDHLPVVADVTFAVS